jgi:hypothetical protein
MDGTKCIPLLAALAKDVSMHTEIEKLGTHLYHWRASPLIRVSVILSTDHELSPPLHFFSWWNVPGLNSLSFSLVLAKMINRLSD